MTKHLILMLFAVVFLWVPDCGYSSDGDAINGKWRGTVTEKGQSTLVELQLVENNAVIAGSFTILNDTGEDVEKGMIFPVVQAERSGNVLKFIVPVSGKVDDDAIAFDLMVEGKNLEGNGHELRKGSDKLPITFIRQE